MSTWTLTALLCSSSSGPALSLPSFLEMFFLLCRFPFYNTRYIFCYISEYRYPAPSVFYLFSPTIIFPPSRRAGRHLFKHIHTHFQRLTTLLDGQTQTQPAFFTCFG
ncbi:hypothetical protein M440DRAFT_314470 [Trichoderma longibrachiatum ATCC 18648]|uniref:Secreted protein n=1 Tax=Trichoderma longibrachiatum ATCC 18648 TaxID=983965 RepID=A0A2T4C3H4_TRILO|nr:hypothetical protein M440DRAFT_314470 [Trichoderma longibrachiatum ATCC 18648]